MRGGPFCERLTPGVNVDRIDVAAGMRALVDCGYPSSETEHHMVVQHALMRWARGEEEAAVRGAIDKSFHGIDLTSWIRVLATARAAAELPFIKATATGKSSSPAHRFPNVYCSSCGGKLGPGDEGFGHCSDHAHLADLD